MKFVRSIRARLGMNAFIVSVLLFSLTIGFGFFYWRISTELERMYETEIVPQRHLVTMQGGLNAIHSRMQRVMLSQSSPEGALLLLNRQHPELHRAWQEFKKQHAIRGGDPVEAELIADINRGLAELDVLVARVSAAYAFYDPVELSDILENDWYVIDLELLHPFRELIGRQNEHAEASYRQVHRELVYAATLLGVLLLAVMFFLIGGSISLYRYMTRRISAIERALDRVARGEAKLDVTFPAGEKEMLRIAGAINATMSQLARDRESILSLMETNAAVLRAAPDGIYGVDSAGRTIFANRACTDMLGFTDAELLGNSSHFLFHHHKADGSPYPQEECPVFLARQSREAITRGDESFFRKDGSSFPIELTAVPMHDSQGIWSGTVVIFRDVTLRRQQAQAQQELIARLTETNRKLADAQNQLLQAEKMASIGQLAAGVAHEINNPVGFVNSNLTTLQDYVTTLMGLVDTIEQSLRSGDSLPPEVVGALRVAMDRAELAYLRQDLGELFAESRDGLERVKKIVLDLKNFSRVDASEWQENDLVAGIESTINVVWNELKYKAEIVRDYGELPRVMCNLGKINQVFMNLLVNAAHAIPEKGTITIATRVESGTAVVRVSDTGTGIAPENLDRIFDPFFTTKPVGKGTGLGLSVSYGIVRDHGGTISVESQPGKGSTFTIRLPISGRPPNEAGAKQT